MRSRPSKPDADRVGEYETAAYIEELSAELHQMARGVGLESLAYFLEMVRIEASIQAERYASADTPPRPS